MNFSWFALIICGEVYGVPLDFRKKQILQAIVDDYIESAEPIASKSLVSKHDFHVSSATVRNEMADLELMGYLEQPHTSAGRIPSDKGYREYVDSLMRVEELSPEAVSYTHLTLPTIYSV